jgi:DNA repair protein RecO (recombination protein O)
MSNDPGRKPEIEGNGRIFLQDAFVLFSRNYRETSLLLDILTQDFGRLRLLAKGARRHKNHLSCLLQPFIPLSLSWCGRGELPILTAAEPKENDIGLKGTDLFCGFYMNELLLHFLPIWDSQPSIFHLYRDTLSEFQHENHQEQILRYFELSLLEEVGYGLTLDRETTQGLPVSPDKIYAYRVDAGPMEIDEETPEAIHGATLLGLKQKQLSHPIELLEAKRLMRRVIHHYLEGRTLKSRDFFKQITTSSQF